MRLHDGPTPACSVAGEETVLLLSITDCLSLAVDDAVELVDAGDRLGLTRFAGPDKKTWAVWSKGAAHIEP